MPEYKSFSTAAKTRFRPMAAELGYEQITGTLYARNCGGWYQAFGLQASQGNEFFYINYGISIPDLCPVDANHSILDAGFILGHRLRHADGTGAFPRATTEEIEASAACALEQYKAQALPWFTSVSEWDAIAAEYLRINPISEASVGNHASAHGEGFRSAIYGYTLLKAGRTTSALRWLREAERILGLPEYITRDGRLVHEKEKGARLQKPDDATTESLTHVEQTLRRLGAAA